MTKKRRYYVLVATLICSMGIRNGYGTYYTGGLHEVGISSNFCGTISDDDPCAVCGNGGQELCEPDNACFGRGHKNYKSGDYFDDASLSSSGYYVCDAAGSGWVHTDLQPATCDASTCKSTDWEKYNNTSERYYYRYCEEMTPYRSVCITETRYRCVANYYGQSDAEGSPITCDACPSSPDYTAVKNSNGTFKSSGIKAKGLTNGPGAEYISDCYIPALGGSGGEGYIDGTGVYKFTSDCFYG